MTIFWSITKLGKSVRRVIREGLLALFRTSYKELSHRGIHPSSGVHHLFLKGDKFHSESAGSHWPSLVCSISPLLLNGFQSSLISLESYFQGESNAICYEGQGLLLMENVGNYRNCATRCRWGDVQCHALSTQTTQDSPGAEPRRSKRKLRQIFGIKLNRQLILFQTHRLVARTQTGHRHPNWSRAPKLVAGTQAGRRHPSFRTKPNKTRS